MKERHLSIFWPALSKSTIIQFLTLLTMALGTPVLSQAMQRNPQGHVSGRPSGSAQLRSRAPSPHSLFRSRAPSPLKQDSLDGGSFQSLGYSSSNASPHLRPLSRDRSIDSQGGEPLGKLHRYYSNAFNKPEIAMMLKQAQKSLGGQKESMPGAMSNHSHDHAHSHIPDGGSVARALTRFDDIREVKSEGSSSRSESPQSIHSVDSDGFAGFGW